MNEQEKNQQSTTATNEETSTSDMAPTAASSTTESTAQATDMPVGTTADAAATRPKWPLYVGTVVIVVAILLGVLYMMEKEGRSETEVFSWLLSAQEAGAVVATVNGTEIRGSDLATSVEQFKQMAAAQGANVNDPEVQGQIRAQALEVLVNTELLKQAAAEAGISVSDEEASARFEEIVADIGGEEVLEERMASLGVDRASLMEDIRDEMLIDRYLDAMGGEEEYTATEEEIVAFYDQAGGEEAGLPPLKEVRAQIEQQLVANAEQAVIDETITKLRSDAEIETTTE